MRGKRASVKRDRLPDPIYNSKTIARFINKLMLAGKKSIAEQIFYDAMAVLKEKTGKDPKEIFDKAMDNVKPEIEVRSRRVGGATYQVPVEVRSERKNALAMRWIINYSRARNEKSMSEKLANELLDAFKNVGNSIKKKDDTHRMAEANKAFAHFRW